MCDNRSARCRGPVIEVDRSERATGGDCGNSGCGATVGRDLGGRMATRPVEHEQRPQIVLDRRHRDLPCRLEWHAGIATYVNPRGSATLRLTLRVYYPQPASPIAR